MNNCYTKSELDKYLKRINIGEKENPSLDFLFSLQESHLLNVPFENLDIHCGTSIDLDIKKIYDKIVLNNRGGFCYELNSIFFILLKTLGYKVKLISARVFSNNVYGPEFDHMAIISKINNEEYLIDVGFGEFAFGPLKISLNHYQHDKRGVFIFNTFNNNYLRLSTIENEMQTPQYIFQNRPRKINDFHQMCFYHQSSPKSHFTKNKVVTLPTQNGRITLNSDKLKITTNGNSSEIYIADNQQFKKYLKDHFNIALEK